MKRFLLTIGSCIVILILAGMLIGFNADKKNFSGIVFLEFNKQDSYDLIVAKTYTELRHSKPKSVFLSFDKCIRFDKEKLEFYYPEEEIMNPEIELTDSDIGNQYFSIVINDKIIITGLNRIGYFGAKMLKEDCLEGIYICWIGLEEKRFKLTTDYSSAFNMVLDQDIDSEKIKTKKIEEYFLKLKENTDNVEN